jgi:hypothetical protein
MVETFTPAVCGSRSRQRAATLLFALSAVAASALLGGLLGLAGETLDARRALLVAAGLALLAAAREAGLVRFLLPQARRQVPDGWRFRLPLPVWTTGYGAGLGAGIFTYQPFSTFWVACLSALALARPLPAALCFSLFGAGRALMVVAPRRRAADAAEAVERLTSRRGAVARANVAALAACAALLAFAPAAGGALVGPGLDPAVGGSVLALARQDGSVVARASGVDYAFPGASAPALDGQLLAYVDAEGIRIVRWQTGEEVRRLRTRATAVALDWPLVVFRREDRDRRRLIRLNLETRSSSVVASVRLTTDLGRPSLRRGRIAWHVATRRGSRIKLLTLSSGDRRTIARSKIALLRNPSLSWWRVVWTEQRPAVSTLRLRSLSGNSVRTIARIRSRDLGFWSTALARGTAYATRWSLRTRSAQIYSFGY